MTRLAFVYTFLLICCVVFAGCSGRSGNANSGRGNRGGGNSANQIEPSGSESPTPTPTPDQQQVVNKLVADLGTALAQGNADQLDQYLSDGYIHINDDGQIITKADILVGLRQGTIKFTSINFEEINTRVYGDSAVVTAGLFAVNSGGGKQVNLQDRVTLVAERENGTWRFVSGQMTPVHAVPQSGNSKGSTGTSTGTGGNGGGTGGSGGTSGTGGTTGGPGGGSAGSGSGGPGGR